MNRWIVTMGGCGYLPASGTWASLLTCLILWPIWIAAPTQINLIAIFGTILFSFLCVTLGKWATDFFGKKDPGQCVLDEAAGICLASLFFPAVHLSIAGKLLAIFIAFRIFDITKPFPLRRLERLPYGWGILLDDLGAAIYANLLCRLVLPHLYPA